VTFQMLSTKEYPGNIIPSVVVQDPGEIIGQEAVRRIRAGVPLYSRQFREVPTVKKGERTMVFFEKGKVRLTIDGLIMADAKSGDFVKVLNQSSKQMLQGIVQQNGSVLVN
jgi:flagella basal body P-ring formation protein FlgA